MKPSAVLSSVLLLAATTSAWPSMLSNPVDAFKREIAPLLIQRQDDSSSSASSQRSSEVKESTTSKLGDSSSETGSRTEASPSATPTGDNNNDNDNKDNEESSSSGSSDTAKNTGTAKSSGSQSGSATGSQSGTKTTSKSSSASVFDPRMPAGGASMITPDAMSPASYYKINDYVTFVWNYTSLSRDPKFVDVLATCTANNALYTIAANETFEQTQSIVWDTGNYQATGTIPLLTETYTLIVHDAAKDVSATASPGYLGTWKGYQFAMYEPQPYTPIADYVCATCSSAMSLMEKQTYGFLFSMVGVTIFTFGWFTGAVGLW
jgi:hypothetical protein